MPAACFLRRYSRSLIIFTTIVSVSIVHADQFPGQALFDQIVGSMQSDVENDDIHLDSVNGGSPMTRRELCESLVSAHNENGNADLCGEVSVDACEDALENPQYSPEGTDLDNWAGEHSGEWTNNTGESFEDNATWNNTTPTPEGGERQSVNFGDNRGPAWNESHPESSGNPPLSGWDPKDPSKNDGGMTGTHIGYSFSECDDDTCMCRECIVWITPKEAFLECLCWWCGITMRTSTGFFGQGQWFLSQLNSGETQQSLIDTNIRKDERRLDSIQDEAKGFSSLIR